MLGATVSFAERLATPMTSPVAGQRWVVVGAGSGGCVVARRLVDAGASVVLVESGPDLAPGAVPAGISGDDCFAAMTPDRVHGDLLATRVAGGASTVYLRGRGVGGSSAVNAMVGLHCDRELYAAWNWPELADFESRVLVPTAEADDAELGPVDRALMAASSDATKVALTRRDGRRVTSAEAYLWPILGSDRFELRCDTVVDRLELLDDRVVTGARLADGQVIEADRVALCAGAIHTPTILLRSSSCPSLTGFGLADHAAAAISLLLAEPGAEMGLAVATVVDRDPIQILPMNHLGTDRRGLGLLMVSLMRPHSASGRVRLASNDPLDAPIVEFDLLSDQRDVAILREGVRQALRLLASAPMHDIVREAFIDDVGTTVAALDTDADIDDWLRRRGADYVHASGTCAAGSVVDANGAVIGLSGVTIADASVFPSIPNVNTHLPTMAVAEMLVDRWIRSNDG